MRFEFSWALSGEAVLLLLLPIPPAEKQQCEDGTEDEEAAEGSTNADAGFCTGG